MHEKLRNMGQVRLVGFTMVLQKHHCHTNHDFTLYQTEELISWVLDNFYYDEGAWVHIQSLRKVA